MNQTPNRTLHQLVFALDRGADALLRREFGITYSRALALDALLGRDGMTQHALASAVGRTDPAVSVMLTELTAAGYTSIEVDPGHKRKNVVRLTSMGNELARQISALLSEKFHELVTRADVDIATYTQMTDPLCQALDRGAKKGGI
ncbi:hypothetical protein GCM10027449_29540 [Sinomonas notoginsengisoli]|uniref:MarR family winged helix-turn-helix transcriptional regulator n=1 Tax=Sinomonas notoginsengisoli TaxID=1457311 RepID=UPI001F3B85D5|nr:MarR family transcriptional regulator [Sinomonas notoginsengisoli]